MADRATELLAGDLAHGRGGELLLAGVDEAGRGCWAGPVVAAAVILPHGWCPPGLDDSKRVPPALREELYREVRRSAVAWAACAVGPRVIEARNILAATLLAMSRAVARLEPTPELVLIDGLQTPALAVPARAIIRGDGTSAAIAAASVLAKVLRDRIMVAWDRRYPAYGFAEHKGYGAPLHREALRRHGPCALHRVTYRPVAECAQTDLWNRSC